MRLIPLLIVLIGISISAAEENADLPTYVLKDGQRIAAKGVISTPQLIQLTTLDGKRLSITPEEVVEIIPAKKPPTTPRVAKAQGGVDAEKAEKSKKLANYLQTESRGGYDDPKHTAEQAVAAAVKRFEFYKPLATNPKDHLAILDCLDKVKVRITKKIVTDEKKAVVAQNEALVARWKSMPIEVKPQSSILDFRFSPGDGGVDLKVNVGEGTVNWRSFNVYFYEGNTRIADRIVILKDMKRNTSLEESFAIDPARVTRIEVKGDLNF